MPQIRAETIVYYLTEEMLNKLPLNVLYALLIGAMKPPLSMLQYLPGA